MKKQQLIALLLSGAVLINLMAPFLFFSAIPRAHAAVPTYETNPVVVGSVAKETAQTLLEWAMRFVRENLRKRLLDMMVDQIIQWIQGGGKPQFVTDWQGFLGDAANIAAGDFLQEIGAGFLCDPFNLQVQIALYPVPKFTDQITCTLDQVVDNIENFYDDFRNGGWIAGNARTLP